MLVWNFKLDFKYLSCLSCLNVLNLNHLTSLSLAIYVMNKFYELDTLESDFEQKIDQEFKKYSFIKNCIIKCFQQPNNR